MLKLFWQQKNYSDDFDTDYNSLDETDKKFFNYIKDIPIEIDDGEGNTYNLTIPEIYKNYDDINWYESFPAELFLHQHHLQGQNHIKTIFLNPLLWNIKFIKTGNDVIFKFKAKAKEAGEFGDGNEKTFTFRNVGGSNDFEGKYVIFNLKNVKFENGFDFLYYYLSLIDY